MIYQSTENDKPSSTIKARLEITCTSILLTVVTCLIGQARKRLEQILWRAYTAKIRDGACNICNLDVIRYNERPPHAYYIAPQDDA